MAAANSCRVCGVRTSAIINQHSSVQGAGFHQMKIWIHIPIVSLRMSISGRYSFWIGLVYIRATVRCCLLGSPLGKFGADLAPIIVKMSCRKSLWSFKVISYSPVSCSGPYIKQKIAWPSICIYYKLKPEAKALTRCILAPVPAYLR